MRCLCVALFLAWLSYSQGQYSCDKYTACSCEGSNFTKIDVENILGKQVKEPVKDPNKPNKYDYLIDFCKGRTCENDAGIGGGKDAVACQRQIDGQQNVSVKLGDVKQHTWQVFDNNTFTVLFGGGDIPGAGGDGTRAAMLYVFVVDKTYSANPLNSVTYVEERITGDSGEFHVYVFNIYITASEERSKGNIAGAIGLSIIFIALAALIAYFVIGGILMFAVKGARGVEVIPNYTFWKALPIYFKDGILFTISPCLKAAGKGKSGYQSL